MFSTVRYFIKTSIIFLIFGLLTGLHMLLADKIFNISYAGGTISAHTHIILVGSVMMMIMGVALWFFPRPPQQDKKYNPDLIRLTYWVMTISTIGRYILQITNDFLMLKEFELGIIFFSFFQIISIILFFISIWGRIRPLGSALREKEGEKF